MRWSIIRVIWVRELRDQLRDRRTLFMIAVLPILLYPLAGVGLMQLAAGFSQKPEVVGVYGVKNLPDQAFPSLLERDATGGLQVTSAYLDHPDDPVRLNRERQLLQVRALTMDVDATPSDDFAVYRKQLEERSVDLVVIVPADFANRLRDDDHPSLFVLARDGDENSRAVNGRFTTILTRWRKAIKEKRFEQRHIPPNFDDPFKIDDPERAKPAAERAATNLVALMLRMFPFILVMWSLAGALYPAVDLCAGEKERGTMETLLISPASREEIVWGKFLTIWVFSAATALLNLLSMAVTAWTLGSQLPLDAFRPAVLFWSVLLVLPLSAFFSAVSLAVGAYARSSKEGQYYLMPLFLVTLPLVCLTLAPGVELSPLYSMVPVTGIALLLQKLISPDPQASTPWLYFIPVLAPMVIYSWLALRWAIAQFQREEVLFREAERLDVGLWLRRLFREKEALPTAGQAFFCFAMLLVLRWLSLGFGRDKPVLSITAVCQLAFTACPPLFMALLLTTRPRQGLGLRLPPAWSWPAAALLAVLCVPPLAWLTLLILDQFPGLKLLLEEHHPLTGALQSTGGLSINYLLVLAVLPALCEELAFRGFILTGLRRRFSPWTAMVLSSFLFAVFQMNVFQFVPHFVLGLLLALIALRTNSVAPSMVFHLVYNLCFIAPLVFPQVFAGLNTKESEIGMQSYLLGIIAGVCALLAVGLLAAMLLSAKQPLRTESRTPLYGEMRPEAFPAADGGSPSDSVTRVPL